MQKTDRLDNACELLNEMLSHRTSNIHQVIAQMLKGDFDDNSNWQMVEYVFDKLNSEGCAFGMRFYNTLLEALWWLGQKARAARVLKEATKRGLFPELFRNNKLVWCLDVHRMWPGSACTAISIWMDDMFKMFKNGIDLPHLATLVVVRRGQVEKSSETQDFPVAKVVHAFLKDSVLSSSFSSPAWNSGRIVSHQTQLKRLLSDLERASSESDKEEVFKLDNTLLPLPLSKTSTSPNGKEQHGGPETERRTRRQKQLISSTV